MAHSRRQDEGVWVVRKINVGLQLLYLGLRGRLQTESVFIDLIDCGGVCYHLLLLSRAEGPLQQLRAEAAAVMVFT